MILAIRAASTAAQGEGDNPVAAECRRIAAKLASVGYEECLDRKLVISGGYSVEHTPLLYKEYPPLKTRRPLGRVLLVGGIHGDEYASVTIVFKWMKILDLYHSGLFHWHFVPLLNPDGLLREHSRHTNADNVDLNRNFPMPDWSRLSHDYWVDGTNRNPRHFPGDDPLSEPESSWLAQEIHQFQPDVIVAVHAPHEVADYDRSKDEPYKLGRLYLHLLRTYPGSLGNYAGEQLNIPVVSIELPFAGVMPTSAEVAAMWRNLVDWLIKNIDAGPSKAAP